jgi:phage-related minor tail protein
MPGVALSSLRVSMDGDSSGYVRAAAAKVEADSRMIAADKARYAAMAQADMALAKAIPGVAALSRSLLDGYGAGATFEAQIRKIGNAVDRGLGLDRAGVLLEATYRKFGLTADAAALAERGFVSIAPAVDALNARMAAAAVNAERLQGQLRAQSFQQGLNAQFGIGGPDTSTARAADVQAYGAELDRLRAKFVPLFAAGREYRSTLDEINQAARVGAISEAERAAALASTKAAFADQVVSLRQTAAATTQATAAAGLQRYELINLSRQAQDVVVSLAGGQGLGTVLLQQGSQIGDVFASSSGTLAGFARQSTSYLTSFLTLGRVAFGGVTLAIGGATLALNNFLSEQDKVKIALSGAGRASGASLGSVNAAADAGASAFGLSASGARALATELVATGKVANDNLLPIIKIGKDFATTFGVTDAEAARQLGAAFSDPVRGAEQLNERLGFLDAGMQRQIASLVAQNKLYEAQRVLLTGVQGSLAKTSEVTSVWSQAWTGLKNSMSDVFDYIGGKLAAAGGLNASLEQQREALQRMIASYDEMRQGGSFGGADPGIEGLKRQLAEINALIERRATATRDVAAAQASLRLSQIVMAQLPEIGARQALADAASVGGAVAEDPIMLQKFGLTQQQADRARAILQQLKNDFKTTFEEIRTSNQIAFDAVTAFSPAQKAAIAQRQAMEQYRAAGGLDPSEKARIGQDAYNLSIRQTITALNEAARVRALAAGQSVQSAQLEIDLLGKTIGQQAELRANLQARQQLEQEASQYRTAFDNAQYERLRRINAELGKQTQLAAQAAMNDNIKFGARTSLLAPEDVQIAQQLKGIYPDVATALNSVEAAGLRVNNALSGVSSQISGQLTTGLADIFDGTKSISQGFGDMGKVVARAIQEMIVKLYIVIPLMRALQSMIGGPLNGIMGGGGSMAGGAASTGAEGVGGIGGLYANGQAFGHNVVPFARGSVFGNRIFDNPTLFKFAYGGGVGNGVMGEAGPEAVMPLRRGPDGRLGVSAGGGAASSGAAPQFNVIINNHSSEPTNVQRSQNETGGIDWKVMIGNAAAEQMGKPGSALRQVTDNRGFMVRR